MSDILEQEISEKRKQEQQEPPVLTAQRFLNIFRQIHIFSERKRKQFDQELLALPTEVIIALEGLPGASLLTAHIDELKGISPANRAHTQSSSMQTKTKPQGKATEPERAPEHEKVLVPEKVIEPEVIEKARIPFFNQPQPTIIDNSFAETLSQSLANALHQMEKSHSADIKQLMEIIINSSKKNDTPENKEKSKETTQQFSEALSMVMDSQTKMFSGIIEAQTKTISNILSTQNAQRAAEAAAISYAMAAKEKEKSYEEAEESSFKKVVKNNFLSKKKDEASPTEQESGFEESVDTNEGASHGWLKKLLKKDASTAEDTSTDNIVEELQPEPVAVEEDQPKFVVEDASPAKVETIEAPSASVDETKTADITEDQQPLNIEDIAFPDDSTDETSFTDSFEDDSDTDDDDSSDDLEEAILGMAPEHKKKKKKKKNKNKNNFENGQAPATEVKPSTDFSNIAKIDDSANISAPAENISKNQEGDTSGSQNFESIDDIFADMPEQTIYDFDDYEETPANDFNAPENYNVDDNAPKPSYSDVETIAIDDFKPITPTKEPEPEPEPEPVSAELSQDEEALQNIKTSLADFASDTPVSLDDWSWDNLDESYDSNDEYTQQIAAEKNAADVNSAPVAEENTPAQPQNEDQNQDYEWEYAETPADAGDDSEWEWEYEEVPEGEDDSEWEWEYEEVPEEDNNQ